MSQPMKSKAEWKTWIVPILCGCLSLVILGAGPYLIVASWYLLGGLVK